MNTTHIPQSLPSRNRSNQIVRSTWNPFSRSNLGVSDLNSESPTSQRARLSISRVILGNKEANQANHDTTLSFQSCDPSLPSREPTNKDVLGLTCLYDGTDSDHDVPLGRQVPIDIIAVHGLNGKSHSTWTSRSDAHGVVNWIQDFLPVEFPGSRIYTFGYNADLFWSQGNGDIASFAQDLLCELTKERLSREVFNLEISPGQC